MNEAEKQQLMLSIDDAVDTAIGMSGGVIVVRNSAERELAMAQLKSMALRAHTPNVEQKVSIHVVPGARTIHWRPKSVLTD